jgi:hypothetical protein
VPPGATYKVQSVGKTESKIPFHVAFMSIFDHNKDGVLHVAELNAMFSALEQQATKDLDILRSQGRYSFNVSVPSPASFDLAKFPSAHELHASESTEQGKLGSIDSNGDEFVTAEEFSRSGYTILRHIMKVYDGNRDGTVCCENGCCLLYICIFSPACLSPSIRTPTISLSLSLTLSISVCLFLCDSVHPHHRARALSLSTTGVLARSEAELALKGIQLNDNEVCMYTVGEGGAEAVVRAVSYLQKISSLWRR